MAKTDTPAAKTPTPTESALEKKVNVLIKEVRRLLLLRGDSLEISRLDEALGEAV